MKKHWISVLRLALILICPLAATLACQLVSLQDLPAAWDWLVSSPRPAAMYCMALLLVQMVLTGLTRLSGLAGLLAALPPFALLLCSPCWTSAPFCTATTPSPSGGGWLWPPPAGRC